MIKLSAPAKSGFEGQYEDVEMACEAAAELLDCPPTELIERTSGDGDTTYLYATEEEADADKDGAYAVQYVEVEG